jgi:Secretion system C-terminal sorting domain
LFDILFVYKILFFNQTHSTMKNILTLLLCILGFSSLSAQVLSEDFNYTGLLTDNKWTAVSGGGTNALTSSGASLVKMGYINSGIGNSVSMVASGEDSRRDFPTAITTGSLFTSFLVNVKTVGRGKNSYVAGLTSGTTGSNYNLRFYVGRDSLAGNVFNFGIGRGTSTPIFDTTKMAFNTTYLVTFKYVYNTTAANNDTVAFFVHPANSTVLTEPVRYTVNNLGAGTGSDATELVSFFLRQGTASDSVTLTVDGIRVDRTWAGSVSRVSSVTNPNQIGFTAYPSVTSSVLTLQWDKNMAGTGNIQVVNLLGQTVLTQKANFTEGGKTLDVSGLSKGAYWVQLHSEKGIFSQQIQKQ